MHSFSAKKSIAEAIGTFLLAFGVGLTVAVQNFPLPTILVAGLILGVVVYTIGNVSGAQINPAVTVGLWSVKKIAAPQAIANILAQLLAGFIAYICLQALHAPLAPATDTVLSALGEVLGAFVLVWGIAAVVFGKVQPAAAGLTIGGSLMLGIVVASFGSLGVLNPAVALGVGAWNFVYFLAPLLGGILGAQLYKWIIDEKSA